MMRSNTNVRPVERASPRTRPDRSLAQKLTDYGHKWSTALHRAIFQASDGAIFGSFAGMPVAELVTTGRRSGRERSTMLAVPIVEADRMVLVASFGGDDRNPAWYYNLRANPEVRITVKGKTRRMLARTASAEERAELWPRLTSTYEGYAKYQRRTSRPIPVVILEPRSARND